MSLKVISNFKNVIRSNSTFKKDILPEVTEIRKITQEDLNKFSSLCGDLNPIHSEQMPENERYVHGAFLNSLISGLMGTKIPGPGSIVISQQFKFLRKCLINKDIKLNVKLLDNRKIMKATYFIKQDEHIVFQGEANLIKMSLQKPQIK